MALLTDHRDLGIHTELLSDGLVDLIESGAATGLSKTTRPGKVVTTFALGTHKAYEYLADNLVVEMLPVDWVNDPRVIGREQHFASINGTIEVDFLGQCNSEIIDGLLVGQWRPGRLRPSRGDHRQEHRRQGGDRIRRGRAARPHHRGVDPGSHRHRPPRPSGRTRRRGPRAGLTSRIGPPERPAPGG
jgi:hypothetical protein